MAQQAQDLDEILDEWDEQGSKDVMLADFDDEDPIC